MVPGLYKANLTVQLTAGGSETTVYVDSITTLTGEAFTFSSFSPFTRGTIIIDPEAVNSDQPEIISFTGVDTSNIAFTGASRGLSALSNSAVTANKVYHPANTPVVISWGPHNIQDLLDYVNSLFTGSVGNASSVLAGITKLSVNPTSPTSPIALGQNDPILTPLSTTALGTTNKMIDEQALTGIISPFAGRTTPTGWLPCDGSLVSRSTYARLMAVICPSQTATFTNSSSDITATAHAMVAGDKVHFTTTSALPTNFATNTDYYVISAGLATNTFRVALSPGGVAISAGSAGSGVQTLYKSAWGKGDGSSTFALPDLRTRVPVGLAAAAPTTQTLSFESNEVNTGSDLVTILNTVFPSQGQAVVLTSTGTLPTGLSLATTYYIIRASTTTIKFASSLANANAGTAIDLTGAGSGVHTMTYTGSALTVLGRMGGEESHAISISELAAHTHTQTSYSSNAGGSNRTATNTNTSVDVTEASPTSTGGNTVHNNYQPFATVYYIIKT